MLCVLALVAYFLILKVVITEPTNVYVALPRDFTATSTRVTSSGEVVVAEIPERISFTGDIMLGRHVEHLANVHGVDYITAGLPVGYLASSSVVVVNFESAMANPHVRTPSFAMQFSTPTSMLTVLETFNVTHASLANNHSLDYGVSGYHHAIAELSQSGIATFGHATQVSSSSVAYVSLDDLSVAVLGIHTLFTKPDVVQLQTQLRDLGRTTDVQLVYVHWGTEYQTTHSPAERSLAEALIEAGADGIIGHHPHVTQDIELIAGVPVFYSLGNFIFDQYFDADVQEGYNLHLEKGEVGQLIWTIEPHISQVKSQPRLKNPYEKADFLTKLATRSDLVLSDYIVAGRLLSSFTLATSSEGSMITE
jgi:hypothetical protein